MMMMMMMMMMMISSSSSISIIIIKCWNNLYLLTQQAPNTFVALSSQQCLY